MFEPSPAVNTLFPHGQIRLSVLSVYNWGSFCGLHTAPIDPYGTLITGDNGAGKSTLIDGLIALLQASGKAAFNVAAAQGDKADRSIISYVRGSFGSEHDGLRTRVQSKREGAVVSALRAGYVADDGSRFTLASLLWIPNASSALADLKRLYFVARRDLELEELLEIFDRGQARAVKQRYRNDDQVLSPFETFAEYQESYRRVLSMHNENAPALLSRALGLKKIDDLTTLIREFVLEPSTVRESARKAVAEFADLVATHNELIDARRQRDALATLPQIQDELRIAEERRNALNAELTALPIYLAHQCLRLWRTRAEQIDRQLGDIEHVLAQLNRDEADATKQMEARHAEYLQAGGGRIEQLKSECERTQQHLTEVTTAASKYQDIVRLLSLDDRLLEASYRANIEAARTEEEAFEQRMAAAQNDFAAAAAALSIAEQGFNEVDAELREVEKRPDSAIDPRFQSMRDQMAESLGIPKADLLFFGELIDVKDEERTWQGAIERALGGLRTTLAVPASHYRLVTGWLNAKHLGLHVRVQVAREAKVAPQFKQDGYLRKLEWRVHPYRDWLKQLLARHDLACVADTETLNRTPFSMTREGLIHREEGRFEKRDLRPIDDRSEWCLGFSNARRLALLQARKQELDGAARQARANSTSARSALDAVGDRIRLWKELLAIEWDRVDLPRARTGLLQAQKNLHTLQQAGGNLAQAQQRWEAAKAVVAGLQKQASDKREERGAALSKREDIKAQQARVTAIAETGLEGAVNERLSERVGDITDDQLDRVNALEALHRAEIGQVLTGAQNQYATASRRAVGTMSAYRSRDEWRAITAEWGAELDDLPVYLERLVQIEHEGLPKLVEQFRERLNRHTTHSLAGIRSQIANELDDIRERIDTINGVLRRTEFRQGTHLRLKVERDEYEHVRDFNKQLQSVMQAATSDDHEARFSGLQAVIAILEKATSPGSGYTKESLRLLDPRHQLSFVAEDVDTSSGQVRDVLASSSGKSGGEKEAFAGTIVAASLAYVLTPDGSDRPIYASVFLDEAFSNTAEAVSRRVLRVFRELNIHVNLITPFKNLNLARESARSLLIAERNQDLHESRLCQVTWEEIDQRLAERAASRVGTDLALSEVTVEMESP